MNTSFTNALLLCTGALLAAGLLACGSEGDASSQAWPRASGLDSAAAPEVVAKGAAAEPAPAHQVVALVLETRSGESDYGWSFARNASVPAEEADLTIFSSDCGARGRWVTLKGHGLSFCGPYERACSQTQTGSLEVGGSEPIAALGDRFAIMRDDEVIGYFTLAERTETPFDWYEAEPIGPFAVVLDVDLSEPL